MVATPSTRLEIDVDGTEYVIDFKSFSGRDARDFRRETGRPLLQAFDPDTIDLDTVAELLWLHRRKHGEADLELDAVLDAVTLESFTVIPDAPGEVSPEA